MICEVELSTSVSYTQAVVLKGQDKENRSQDVAPDMVSV